MSWREAELYESVALELRNSQALPTPEEFYAHQRHCKKLIGYMNQAKTISLDEREFLLDPIRLVHLFLQEKIGKIEMNERIAKSWRAQTLTAEDFGTVINY